MATLPRVTTSVSTTAGAVAAGSKLCCILAPCALNADMQPRQFGSAAAVYAQHGYSEGVEAVSKHIELTGLPVLFVAMPIGTAGTVGRKDTTGNTGSSVVTITAGVSGVLHEHDGVVDVLIGGTIGSSQIVLNVSADGGVNFKPVRLGTGNAYTIPYVGVALAFGAGTLTTGQRIATWHGSGPIMANADLATVRANLAAQDKLFRTFLLCGDLPDVTAAGAVRDFAELYASSNGRFSGIRASLRDRLPLARMSTETVRMTGSPTLTFAEVGGTGDTITRSSGSWIDDGFAVGDIFTVTGTASNNVSGPIASLSATVMTLGTTDLAAEVTALATVTATPGITFAEVGASGDTITRSRGSWVADGFRAGDKLVVTGTASNNITAAQGLTTVTALVLTLGTDDLAAEVIGAASISITAGQTKAAWMADLDSSFASITDRFLTNLSAGRDRHLSQFSGWAYRRPLAHVATWRSYQHDVHIPTWRKSDGPTGGDLKDTDGLLVEWDDRVDGEAGVAARFTVARTYANGRAGTFIALDLTRAVDGDLLSQAHNAAVVNLARTLVQAIAEDASIGATGTRNADGTPSEDLLTTIEGQVNAVLDQGLLRNAEGEGPRCSFAKWTAARDDDFGVAEPLLNSVLDLELNGTVHSVNIPIKVR